MLLAVLQTLSGQQSSDALQLQKDEPVAKLDHWVDYVRRTGDAKNTLSELVGPQADLKASYDLFAQRQDYAGAALSALKIGHIQRLQNQLSRAAILYQGAFQLAQHANRADYQTTALSYQAYTELQLGDPTPPRNMPARQ